MAGHRRGGAGADGPHRGAGGGRGAVRAPV